MEEKKSTKISLSTFLLVLAIIALVVMGIFIYNLSKEKSIESEKSAELQSQINVLNSTIDKLNNKIDSTSTSLDTETSPNSNSSVLNNTTTNKENVNKIASDLFEKGSKIIREAQYSDYFEYDVVTPNVDKEINGKKYQKRNVLYSDIEKKYSEIFTGEALAKVLKKRFADVDGYLYISYGGATGWNITNINVTKVSEENNEIKYIVKYNDINEDDSLSKEQACNMTIKLINGNYRIISTDYCNL